MIMYAPRSEGNRLAERRLDLARHAEMIKMGAPVGIKFDYIGFLGQDHAGHSHEAGQTYRRRSHKYFQTTD